MSGEPLVGAEHLLRPDVGVASPVFVAGEGVDLITDTGARVLDAVSGVGVTCLGYDQPRIAEAMAAQAHELPYVHALRFETPVQQELADRVAALAPGGLDRCFFVSGGSEATESAIKFARQYWLERGRPGKWRIVGRRPSFHGNTLASLSAGWHRDRRARHQPLLLDFLHIDAPNGYRGCSICRGAGCTADCARALEHLLARERDSVAAFIAEPLVGAAGGAIVPPPGYFEAIREICDRHDVLLIADEVITGFGRTGRWFGIEHEGVEPDLLLFAKGVSAGFAPLGGFVVQERLVEAFRDASGRFEHNFTMAGHPVACAAGVAAIDALVELDAPALVARHECALFAALEPLRESPLVGDVRGRGFLVGVELVMDRRTKQPFPPAAGVAARLGALALDAGVLIYPCAAGDDGLGDHFLLMPAFVTPPDRFGEIAGAITQALERLERGLADDGLR
jgi:adenosylmethionine-8-amino-7-oxononanoate aminotransferase